MELKVNYIIASMFLAGALLMGHSAKAEWVNVGPLTQSIPIQDFKRCNHRIALRLNDVGQGISVLKRYFTEVTPVQFESKDGHIFQKLKFEVSFENSEYLVYAGLSSSDWQLYFSRLNSLSRPYGESLNVDIGPPNTTVVFSYLFYDAKNDSQDAFGEIISGVNMNLEKNCSALPIRSSIN